MTHTVDYKGLTIIYENGLYHIATVQHKKYFTFQEAKEEVDRMTGTELDNFINVKNIKSGKSN